jgi:acetyl-CoA acetyltransferase
VEEDEGIIPCTAEGLAKLKTVLSDSILTAGSQTHAADGNAGMIVTTKEKADELSADKAVTIQILSYGFARAKKAHMPEAPVPASKQALERAGIAVSDLKAVKTHNPFSINDIIMRKELVLKGGGYGLVAGCAAGDSGAGLVIKVN